MSEMTRRDMWQGIGVLGLTGLVSGEGWAAQVSGTPRPDAAPKHCDEPVLTDCKAFPYEGLPVRFSDAGAPTRQILEGRIPSSEVIEIHETTLAPGKMPHAPHRHPHAELLLVRRGTIEFQSDAPSVRVTPGGVAYCAPGKLHGFKNIGSDEAEYFVVKIGAVPVCQT